jgi:hypothetical protein
MDRDMHQHHSPVNEINSGVHQPDPSAGTGIVLLGSVVKCTQGGARGNNENKRQIYA